LRSPVLDPAKVRRLLELPVAENSLNRAEQVEVHLLTPEQLRQSHPTDL
jgi:hypothetical protein